MGRRSGHHVRVPDRNRRGARPVLIVVALAVVGAATGWAVLGGGRDGPMTRSHPAAPPAPSVVVQPHVNWGDYVVVDRVDGPDVLTVHTTRDPRGHDTTPYTVVVGPDTVVHPFPDGTTEVVGVFDGVAPGDRFYVVGAAVRPETPAPIVHAVRIFVGL
jgi:hypothetical protein